MHTEWPFREMNSSRLRYSILYAAPSHNIVPYSLMLRCCCIYAHRRGNRRGLVSFRCGTIPYGFVCIYVENKNAFATREPAVLLYLYSRRPMKMCAGKTTSVNKHISTNAARRACFPFTKFVAQTLYDTAVQSW